MHFRCVYGAIFSTVQYCAKTLFISLLCAMEMGNVSSSLERVNKHGNTVFKVQNSTLFSHVSLVDSRSRCICEVFA